MGADASRDQNGSIQENSSVSRKKCPRRTVKNGRNRMRADASRDQNGSIQEDSSVSRKESPKRTVKIGRINIKADTHSIFVKINIYKSVFTQKVVSMIHIS